MKNEGRIGKGWRGGEERRQRVWEPASQPFVMLS